MRDGTGGVHRVRPVPVHQGLGGAHPAHGRRAVRPLRRRAARRARRRRPAPLPARGRHRDRAVRRADPEPHRPGRGVLRLGRRPPRAAPGDAARSATSATRGARVPAIRTAPTRHRWCTRSNGLPSIELPHAWPRAAPATLAKIARAGALLPRSARRPVVVPSRVIARGRRGTGRRRNDPRWSRTAPTYRTRPRPDRRTRRSRYLVYVGALQPWQGVDVLLRAFTRLADLTT